MRLTVDAQRFRLCCCAGIESKFRNADASRRCPLSFGDNPRPKLAGLLPPKTWPRPRDCRDYAAVTHVARVRSVAPATCKYRYYRVLCRIRVVCVKERHRNRRRRHRRLMDRVKWICRNRLGGERKSSPVLKK